MGLFGSLPDLNLRLAVFGLEIILTFTLIYWMRSSNRGTQEPWSFVLSILAYGAVTAIIAAVVEINYSFNIPHLQETAPQLVTKYGTAYELINNISASMIEELAKYTIAVFTVVNTRHFHKMSDAIVYLILIGLGFSLVEDAIFLISPQTDAPYRLLSFYVHSGTSAIIGYTLGRFKFGLAGYPELMRAVCGAIFLHFGYNLATNLQDSQLAFWLTISITLYISLQVFILFRRAIAEEYELEQSSQLFAPVEQPKPTRLLNLNAKKPRTPKTA